MIIMREIKRFIRPIKYKEIVSQLLDKLSLSLLAALSVTLVLIVASRFIVLPHALNWGMWLTGAGLVIGAGWTLFYLPNTYQIAKLADQMGLKERLITALELNDNTSAVADLQRQDMLKVISNSDLAKRYRLRVDYKKWMVIAILLLAIVGVLQFNTKASILAQDALTRQQQLEEQVAQIEESIAKATDQAALDAQRAKRISEQLKAALKASKTEEDIAKALAVAKNELKDIKSKIANSQLPQAQKESRSAALNQAIEQINQAGRALDNQSLSEYAFSEETDDQASAANAAAGGQSGANSGQSANGGATGGGQASGQSGGSGQGEGNGQGQGNGQGEGNGQGQGSGQGKGEDEGAGSGAGAGSTNEDMSGEQVSPENANSSSQNNKPDSEYKVGLYEALYPPDLLGGNAPPDFVPGATSESGEISYNKAQTLPNEAGELINYNQIIQSYSDKAYNNLEDKSLPYGMKDIIKDYFSELNQ